MNIELPKRTAEFVEDQVRSGGFASPEEVVTAALESFRADCGFGDFAPGELDDLLEQGERSGELDGWHERDAARLKLAARLHPRRESQS